MFYPLNYKSIVEFDSNIYALGGTRFYYILVIYMPPQEKLPSLEDLYKLSLENNKILRSLRRHQRIGLFFTILYWGIIIASLLGAYYYIRPVVGALTNNNQQVQSTLDQFEALRAQLPEAQMFENFFQKFRGGQATTTEDSFN